MPVTAEYTWAESETAVQLQVPLKGQSRSKLDVFATECYLKVSFPPYLLQVDLAGYIDSTQPKARVEDGTLFIKAKKKEGSLGLWGSLGQPVARKCDPAIKARREESIKEKLKREEELKERVSLRRHEDERLALRSQMSVEEDERRRIEDIKADEKEKAEAEVYRAFEELAAKRSREESATTAKVLPLNTDMAQPKKMDTREEHQSKKNLPMQTSSSRHRLGTIEEGDDETNGPTPLLMDSDAAAPEKGTDENFIWAGEAAGSDDGDEGHSGHEKIASDNSCVIDDAGEADESSPDSCSLQTTKERHQQQGKEEQEEEGGDDNDDHTKEETCKAESDEKPVSYTPAPRASGGVVPVGFTTRLFPTPLRESKMADESAWIMKNRRYLHKNKALVGKLPSKGPQSAEDLQIDISESDPVWLKGRGDDLYRGGDFLGAVNAYTAALDADPKAAACLSNRAACYLRLSRCGSGGEGNSLRHSHASACVADCGAALELLQAQPETGPSQARALARRSLAYRELGHYRSSLEDCRAALLFSPGNATLLEEIARGEPLARAEQCNKEAATRFASRDISGACEMYTAALEAVPSFPSALSNRAACHLALGKPQECVRDCTTVLDMLSVSSCSTRDPSFIPFNSGGDSGNPPGATSRIKDAAVATTSGTVIDKQVHRSPALAPASSPPLPPPPVGSMPPPGSEKRTKWVLATVLRRARACVQLEDLEGALRDYRIANAATPGDKAVEADIRELERRVNEDSDISKPSRNTTIEDTIAQGVRG